jgi:XTP/dITP diphosphohydrolase
VKLLVATRNGGKLREIRDLLDAEGIEVIGLRDLPAAPEVEEDEDTFLGNARKKAWALAEASGLPVLADDSGLSVDALGGRPGVHSARFAGPAAHDEENNRKLLREMEGVAPAGRKAAFVCAMVLAVPGHGEHFAEGRLEGSILEAARGTEGFGYDPLFLVSGRGETLAELALATKNRLSHRGQALNALLPHILALRSR